MLRKLNNTHFSYFSFHGFRNIHGNNHISPGSCGSLAETIGNLHNIGLVFLSLGQEDLIHTGKCGTSDGILTLEIEQFFCVMLGEMKYIFLGSTKDHHAVSRFLSGSGVTKTFNVGNFTVNDEQGTIAVSTGVACRFHSTSFRIVHEQTVGFLEPWWLPGKKVDDTIGCTMGTSLKFCNLMSGGVIDIVMTIVTGKRTKRHLFGLNAMGIREVMGSHKYHWLRINNTLCGQCYFQCFLHGAYIFNMPYVRVHIAGMVKDYITIGIGWGWFKNYFTNIGVGRHSCIVGWNHGHGHGINHAKLNRRMVIFYSGHHFTQIQNLCTTISQGAHICAGCDFRSICRIGINPSQDCNGVTNNNLRIAVLTICIVQRRHNLVGCCRIKGQRNTKLRLHTHVHL